MEDQVFIQYKFTITEGDLRFTDALIMPIEEYELLTLDEIEAMKQERFNNWKILIESSSEDQLLKE